MLEPGAALRLITEAEFLQTTVAILRHGGYGRLLHIIDAKAHARVTAEGWPDIFAIHPQHGLLVAELKTETGRVTAAQYDWLDDLRQHLPPPANRYAASRAHLWRPRDADAIATQAGVSGAATVCRCPVCEANRAGRPIIRSSLSPPRRNRRRGRGNSPQ